MIGVRQEMVIEAPLKNVAAVVEDFSRLRAAVP